MDEDIEVQVLTDAENASVQINFLTKNKVFSNIILDFETVLDLRSKLNKSISKIKNEFSLF